MKQNKQQGNLTGKMKKPLNKRLIRELKGDIGKYIVIFILLVFSIGFVSGFLVAGESMIQAYDESFEKYNIEDGNFRTEEKISDSKKERIEKPKEKVDWGVEARNSLAALVSIVSIILLLNNLKK